MERELRCRRCNKHVPISSLKYEKTGTHLICAECRGQKEQAMAPRKMRPLISNPVGGPKLLKYQCTNCRYMFRRSPVSEARKCPKCGGEKFLRFDKITADQALKMADDPALDRL